MFQSIAVTVLDWAFILELLSQAHNVVIIFPYYVCCFDSIIQIGFYYSLEKQLVIMSF